MKRGMTLLITYAIALAGCTRVNPPPKAITPAQPAATQQAEPLLESLLATSESSDMHRRATELLSRVGPIIYQVEIDKFGFDAGFPGGLRMGDPIANERPYADFDSMLILFETETTVGYITNIATVPPLHGGEYNAHPTGLFAGYFPSTDRLPRLRMPEHDGKAVSLTEAHCSYDGCSFTLIKITQNGRTRNWAGVNLATASVVPPHELSPTSWAVYLAYKAWADMVTPTR